MARTATRRPRPVVTKGTAAAILGKLEAFELSPRSALADLNEFEATLACVSLATMLRAFLRSPHERMTWDQIQ